MTDLAAFRAHVRDWCRDHVPAGWRASQTGVDDEAFGVVRRAIAHVFPEAIVVPCLTVGATDARHYAAVARQAYRFPGGVFRVHPRRNAVGEAIRIARRDVVPVQNGPPPRFLTKAGIVPRVTAPGCSPSWKRSYSKP